MQSPPPPRTKRTLRAVLVAIAPLVLSLSCDDDEQAPPPDPPGAIAFAIGELLPRGADKWRPGDAEPVVIGCDLELGVTTLPYKPILTDAGPVGPPLPDEPGKKPYERGDYLLRPPGTCTRPQCGVVKVTVESLTSGDVATALASVETVFINLSPLGDLDGAIRIRAELLENGVTLAMKNGEPLADELELSVRSEADCAPDGEGGAGGAPSGTVGSAGSAGSGNQGGQSGAGTGGSAGSPGGAGGAPGGAPGEGGEGGV